MYARKCPTSPVSEYLQHYSDGAIKLLQMQGAIQSDDALFALIVHVFK